MRAFRKALQVSVLAVALAACRQPSTSDVSLRVTRDHSADTPNSLGYSFTFTNTSNKTLWFPSCGGVVRPSLDIEVAGQRIDRADGTMCNASVSSPFVALTPGAAQSGIGQVVARSGAYYAPSLLFAQSPSSALQTVGGVGFAAP